MLWPVTEHVYTLQVITPQRATRKNEASLIGHVRPADGAICIVQGAYGGGTGAAWHRKPFHPKVAICTALDSPVQTQGAICTNLHCSSFLSAGSGG
jgi:hypothetical protein